MHAQVAVREARLRSARIALHNIQKEAVVVAAVDAIVTGEQDRGEASRGTVVKMGPSFWTVVRGALHRNTEKVEVALSGGKSGAEVVVPVKSLCAQLPTRLRVRGQPKGQTYLGLRIGEGNAPDTLIFRNRYRGIVLHHSLLRL